MSQHEIITQEGRYTFGWDQPLQSFYLNFYSDHSYIHPVKLGTTLETWMYEVYELMAAAEKEGLVLDDAMCETLEQDKRTNK